MKELLPRVFEGLAAPTLGRAVPRVTDARVGRASPPSTHAWQVGVGVQHSVMAQAGILYITDGAHTLRGEVVQKLIHD